MRAKRASESLVPSAQPQACLGKIMGRSAEECKADETRACSALRCSSNSFSARAGVLDKVEGPENVLPSTLSQSIHSRRRSAVKLRQARYSSW
jgi:hypothetical protein